MAGISSIGIGSGVLTSDLIDKLANAERKPTESRLNQQEETAKAKLSDFGRIQSLITDLRLNARSLGNVASLAPRIGTSSNSAVAVTASNSAAVGQYSMQVSKLASAHSLATGVFPDKDETAIGAGRMTVTVGGVSKIINITNANNTLDGIAKEINNAKMGVSASVINTGSGFQLIMTAEKTGAVNGIEIGIQDNDGDSTDGNGLSRLAYDATTKNLNQMIAAEDAQFSINGISVTRSSNSVSDLIEGLTFNLTAETTSPAIVKVARDTDLVAERVQEFVDKFNELQELINEVTAFNPGGGAGGTLVGNSSVRQISAQSKAILGSIVQGLEGSKIRSLSEVGISTDSKTGKLTLDQTKLKEELVANERDVVALFAGQGRTSDSQVEFVRAGTNTKVGTYNIEITQLATQGSYSGNVALTGSTVVDGDNDSFSVKIDGVMSGPIALTHNEYGYTNEALAAEIQNRINGDENLRAQGVTVKVGLDENNQLTFTSETYGSKSSIEFSAVGANTLATLGINAGSGTAGVDVAGTINGKEATGSGQSLTAAKGSNAEGLEVRITGGALGARGTVSHIEGIGSQFVNMITGFLDLEGAVTTTTEGFKQQLDNIAQQRVKLDQRVESLIARLSKQFTAADMMISRLKSTENFIKGQLEALVASNGKK